MQAVLMSVFWERRGRGGNLSARKRGAPPPPKVFLVFFLVLEHLHGAEFAAHGADIFMLVVFAALVQLLGIKSGFAHHVPVQSLTTGVHGGFAAHGTFAANGYINIYTIADPVPPAGMPATS